MKSIVHNQSLEGTDKIFWKMILRIKSYCEFFYIQMTKKENVTYESKMEKIKAIDFKLPL